MGFQTPIFSLHPELLQIESHGEKKQFCPHMRLASGKKPSESKVRFEQSKRTFNLNRTAQSQIDSVFSSNVFLRFIPQFPEGLLHHDFLGTIRILCLAAGISLRTVATVFATVPGSGHKLSVFQFRTLSPQRKLSALRTDKTILHFVIAHIFNATDLFLKPLRLLRFIIGWLNETELAVCFQI